jgi:hypothetical protein
MRGWSDVAPLGRRIESRGLQSYIPSPDCLVTVGPTLPRTSVREVRLALVQGRH